MENNNLKFVDSDIAETIIKICFMNKELDSQFDNNEIRKIKQFIYCSNEIKNETNKLLSSNGIDEFMINLQSIIDYVNEILLQSQKLAINFKNKSELILLLDKLNQTLLKLNNKVYLKNLQ